MPLVEQAHQFLERLADHLDTLVGARVQLVYLGADDLGGGGQVPHAQARLVQQDLRHALDGDRERDDGVRARPATVVRAALAVDAEDRVARLAEHQLLSEMDGTLGDDVPSLLRHQVEQLVDDEARRERDGSAAWQRDRLATYRAAELRAVATRFNDALQTADADRVRARQQLGVVLDAVVHAQTRAARQEALVEVLVVDRHRLDQRRRHAVDIYNVKHV